MSTVNNNHEFKEETVVENQNGFESEAAMDNQVDTEQEEAVTAVAIDKEKVEKIINNSVYASMGIGVLLLPVVSLASVTAIQLNMARGLAKLYGVEFKENMAKKIITAVVGAGTPVLATGPVEWLVLGIPVFGTALAFATMPALNGLSTYAIGRMFVTHFERGGNFLSTNVDSLKEDFKTAYQNSREKLGDMISGKKAAKAESR